MELVMMTEFYPYSKGEEFIETEIKYLADKFESVVIIPRNGDLKKRRKLPENVIVDDNLLLQRRSNVIRLRIILAKPILAARLFIKDVTGANRRGKIYYKQIIQRIIFLAEAFLARKIVLGYRSRDAIFYSYWGNASALGLALMMDRKELERFTIRLHGYDLYDERYATGGVPYRDYIVRNAHSVACISETGKRYLEKKGIYTNIVVSRLGVNDNGINPGRDLDCKKLRIISCSSVIPIKRVSLIVAVLKEVTIPVEWVHVGDGPDLLKIMKAASGLGPHISTKFLGHLPNNQVIELYRNNHFDLFVHMSETEGIPVSFMESISFGIPVLSTNVGGVAELVTEQTGILIDPEVNIKTVAEVLNSFNESQYVGNDFRNRVREFWQEKFKAEPNYLSFITDVLLRKTL